MTGWILPLLISVLQFAQSPGLTSAPQEPAAITGEIIDEVSGQPVPWVRLVARPNNGMPEATTTGDATGHFSFSGLQPGQYDLETNRSGFLSKNLILSLAPGQRLENFRVSITPQAVIAGKVEDQDGWPVAGSSVRALRYWYENGQRQLRPVGMALTNDLGEYRISGLPAGLYYVRAAASRQLTEFDERYSAGYYPGTLDPRENRQVEVWPGQEIVDIRIRLPRRSGVMVRGRVLTQAASDELERMSTVPSVVLEPTDVIRGNEIRAVMWSWRSDDSFSLNSVPPGDYMLRVAVQSAGGNITKFLAQKSLRVGNSDIEGVVLDLQPVVPQDIPGTVLFEPGTGPEPVTISLQPVARNTIQTTSNEDGAFILRGLVPGKYQLSAHGMQHGSSMKAARLGNNEVIKGEFELDGRSAGPLHLTMAAMARFSVLGTVLDSGRHPVAGALVCLISTSSEFREGRMHATTDQDGKFSIVGLAGEYRVFVVTGSAVPFGSLEDPEFLKANEGNSRLLTFAEGVNSPLTLVLPATK